MSTTFYSEPKQGGVVFRTTRRPGDVRIPNYVYDMWMPLLGACALGIYATYCRLEMGGSVKKITLATLAKACRIGTGKLDKINTQLQDCGFIQVNKPTGSARLMHWTTEIVVQDPPMEVSQALLDKYAPPGGYEVLTPWLMESPENPNRFSEQPKSELRNDPEPNSNIATLEVLQPLNIEETPPSAETSQSPVKADLPVTETPEDKAKQRIRSALDTYFERNAGAPAMSVPAAAGGASDWDVAVLAFAEVTGSAAPSDKVRGQWARVFEQVGAQWEAGPQVVALVIRKKPNSEIGWKAWTTPHAVKEDLAFLLGQHFNGKIRGSQKQEAARQWTTV